MRGRRALQSTTTDCGPACLSVVLTQLGRPVPGRVLRDELAAGRDGVNALDLRDGGLRYGVRGRAFRLAADELEQVPLPAILHWRGNHFVVLERLTRRSAWIFDPAIGRRKLTADAFAEGYGELVLAYEAYEAYEAHEAPADRAVAGPASVWSRILVPAVKGQRRLLAVTAVCSLLLTTLGLALPLTTAAIVDGFVEGGGLGPWTVALVPLLAITTGGLAAARGMALVRLQTGLGRHLASRAVEGVLRAPYRFFERRGTGDLVSRVGSTEVVREVLASQLVAAVLDSVFALGYVAVALAADPVLGSVSAALAVLQLLAMIGTSTRAARLQREELLADARTTSVLVEAVSGIATVKAFGAEAAMGERWAAHHELRLDAAARRGKVIAAADTCGTAVRVAAPVLFLLVAWSRTRSGALGPGEALALAAMAAASLVPVGAVFGHLRAAYSLASVLDHLHDVLEVEPEQASPCADPGELRGGIELADVGFRHDGRGPWAVRHVDVRIEPGWKVAVVGPSGSGKSTLARLLTGLYPPSEGSVRYDGQDLSALDLSSVRSQLGVVLQEPFLFAGSIRDNIALGRPDAELADVIAAARAAGVHDEIATLPLGYETMLAEAGAGLSGGQRQRISLARALLVRPAVLVLDEATSALDVHLEARIEENLRSLAMTQIVISHRLSAVHDADLVLVLQDGQVVEAGPPGDLLLRNGHYAAMVSMATAAC